MATDNKETKIVKAAPKKTESQKDEQPRVTVKAAVIPQRNTKKQQTKPAASTNERPTQRPPMGKPVVNKDLEGRHRPPVGKPVVSKEVAERGQVKETEPAAPVKETVPAEVKAPAAEVKMRKATIFTRISITYLQVSFWHALRWKCLISAGGEAYEKTYHSCRPSGDLFGIYPDPLFDQCCVRERIS